MALWSLDQAVGASASADPGRTLPVFATAQWAHVLEGLGCRVVQVRNLALAETVVVPIFRRGPLRLGFMGFPVCGGRLDALSTDEFDQHAAELARLLSLDIVRGTRAGLAAPGPGICLPEVWTDQLADWPGTLGKKLARDLAFAERACADLEIRTRGGDPAAWHAIYTATVLGHGGKLRYTAEYFRRLEAAAAAGAGLTVFQASDPQGVVRGFAVLAADRTTGYYLHGGVDGASRKSGLSDLLLWRIMSQAKASGLEKFSLMASPEAQTGLIRFKRKWAERQGYSVTRDLGNGIAGRLALHTLGIVERFRRRQPAKPVPGR